MFLEFYNLREQPFGVTPDPRFLYFGSSHREAYASLLYTIETKRGFSALVAQPGMGKTSLIFRMLDALQTTARTAFLFQTEGDEQQLLRSMLRDLGVNGRSGDLVSMRQDLNQVLIKEMHSGKQVVVVIDEAQNLDEKVLESVRLLSNFETSTQKLMHIVLAGQPALAEKLSKSEMTQLRQRVSTIIRLEPFKQEDTAQYIELRLRTAGHEGPPIFSADALEIIGRVSQGIPRNINSLCFQALSIGFASHSKQIRADTLREVVADFDFAPKRRVPTRAPSLPQRPLPGPAANVMPDINSSVSWSEYSSGSSKRPSSKKWIVALACGVIPVLSMFALSDPKLGFTQSLPGRVSAKMVNAVLSSGDPNADFVPALPNRLSPQPAPAAAKIVTPAGDSKVSPDPVEHENANEDEEKAGELTSQQTSILTQRSMTPVEIAYQYLGKADRDTLGKILKMNTKIRDDSQTIPKGTLINLPLLTGANPAVGNTTYVADRGRRDDATSEHNDGPRRAQVLRSETLFQFVVEHYGKMNWKMIEAISTANPQINGPYAILSPGQWLELPGDLGSLTSESDTDEISRGHR